MSSNSSISSSSSNKVGKFVLFGAGLAIAYVSTLLYLPSRLIYFPRTYRSAPAYYDARLTHVTPLEYSTKSGKQAAYLITYGRGAIKQVVCIHGGNAALALDWVDLVRSLQSYTRVPTAYIMIDYPGYGNNEGSPSPSSILESTDGAMNELQSHLRAHHEGVCDSVQYHVIGHSLGCAAILQWTAHITHVNTTSTHNFHLRNVILLSPFTSILNMAHHLIGRIPFLNHLLRHPFDNIEALSNIIENVATRQNTSTETDEASGVITEDLNVHILHGSRDSICPVSMGRRLAHLAEEVKQRTQSGVLVSYREYEQADHNDIFQFAHRDLVSIVSGAGAGAGTGTGTGAKPTGTGTGTVPRPSM